MRTITVRDDNVIEYGGKPVGKLTIPAGELRDDVVATLAATCVSGTLESFSLDGTVPADATVGEAAELIARAVKEEFIAGHGNDAQAMLFGFAQAPELAAVSEDGVVPSDFDYEPAADDLFGVGSPVHPVDAPTPQEGYENDPSPMTQEDHENESAANGDYSTVKPEE